MTKTTGGARKPRATAAAVPGKESWSVAGAPPPAPATALRAKPPSVIHNWHRPGAPAGADGQGTSAGSPRGTCPARQSGANPPPPALTAPNPLRAGFCRSACVWAPSAGRVSVAQMHLWNQLTTAGLCSQEGWPRGPSEEVLRLPLMLKLSIAMGEMKRKVCFTQPCHRAGQNGSG